MLRSVYAFDPVTGAEIGRLSATLQPNLPQLSDADLVAESRRELVRLHTLTQIDADAARYEIHED